eukprot:m.49027 g.49027  ORF g.49027 m.49027 type:complete len:289 (-) comp12441_c0_seq3:311-1177(-)
MESQLRLIASRIRNAVVYQDQHILCFNKWPKLIIQGESGPSVAKALPFLAEELHSDAAETQPKLSIIHRLDKETTGLVLLAKHDDAARVLTSMFAEHNVKKTYMALTIGAPYPDQGTVDLPIGSVRGKALMACATPNDGLQTTASLVDVAPASTSYSIIDHIHHHVALVELKPTTGRKHQLRVHCAQGLQCPILGDLRYGPGITPWLRLALRTPKEEKLKKTWKPRLFLHAYRLQIPNYRTALEETATPGSESRHAHLDLRCPLPLYFKETLLRLELNIIKAKYPKLF